MVFWGLQEGCFRSVASCDLVSVKRTVARLEVRGNDNCPGALIRTDSVPPTAFDLSKPPKIVARRRGRLRPQISLSLGPAQPGAAVPHGLPSSTLSSSVADFQP